MAVRGTLSGLFLYRVRSSDSQEVRRGGLCGEKVAGALWPIVNFAVYTLLFPPVKVIFGGVYLQ